LALEVEVQSPEPERQRTQQAVHLGWISVDGAFQYIRAWLQPLCGPHPQTGKINLLQTRHAGDVVDHLVAAAAQVGKPGSDGIRVL
jgi:hypothetical protein